MKNTIESFLKIILLALTALVWLWALNQPLSHLINLSLIVGCVLLAYPVVWLGRKALDRQPTMDRAARVTMFVHYALVILFGTAIIRAVTTHQDWPGWKIPIPVEIGWILFVITGAVALLTVINLALKGLGAPFAIALTRTLAVEWCYAWTRNPMVLATLAWLLSMGIWFQSTLFVLWVLTLFTPALLTFVKLYEERELEIRFGASYLAYKSRTPMLFPRKPER